VTPEPSPPANEPPTLEALPDSPAPPAAARPSGPEAPPPFKYCLVCHEQIRTSVRVCPSCGTRVVLYEGSGDKQVYRFLGGSLLVAFGSVLSWGGALGASGLSHPLGPIWLLIGVWGAWKMWVGLVARRISIGPLLLQLFPFFWSIKFGLFPLFAYEKTGETLIDDLFTTALVQQHLMNVGVGRLLIFAGSALTLLTFALSLNKAVAQDKAKKAKEMELRKSAREGRKGEEKKNPSA